VVILTPKIHAELLLQLNCYLYIINSSVNLATGVACVDGQTGKGRAQAAGADPWLTSGGQATIKRSKNVACYQ